MTLHCDVFLLKENGTVKKHTYFTTVYRSDRDFKDSLSLGDYVVKEFSKDFPDVKELYCKSDNAGCYHGNPYPESIYKICKQNSITLKRLDYNEPQKGKDQCDRDSALARDALRRYVDEGNDVTSAEDIFKALLASPINNAKVSEVQFDKSLFKVNGDIIQKISYYHSFEFTEAGMKVWRYYGIGTGILVPYSIKWSFTSGLMIIKPFKDCLLMSSQPSQNKPSASRQLCSLLFCEEGGCAKTFDSLAELEEHKFLGIHSIPEITSSFDSVKQAFAIRMLSSTMNHSSLCSSPAISLPSTSSVGGLTECSIFSIKGWALPVHTSFRFKKRQKNFLFKAFADGEHSGKKASPEEVHQNMRNFFDPMDYCSVC